MKIKGIEQVIVELSNDNGVINSFGSPLFNPHKLSGYQIGKESNYLQFSKILPHLSILELSIQQGRSMFTRLFPIHFNKVYSNTLTKNKNQSCFSRL